jgi:sugar/nucleoside kinase (ribokinase family)
MRESTGRGKQRPYYMNHGGENGVSGCDVYVYGMTVLSTIHQLKGRFPDSDSYQEIQQTFVMPGGEAANCAVVLRNLGVSVMLDGCYLGDQTETALLQYLVSRGVDCSKLKRRADFPGWRDIVFCDGESRTVFGWFVDYLFGGETLWTPPCEDAIQASRCVALDPFFGAESARVADLCVKHEKDYVTIDCRWEEQIAQQARAVVCSQEFLYREYAGQPAETVLDRYQAACRGLVIFTFGSRPILYGSPTTARARLAPYQVAVVDTLGAGDTFRAGVVYGLLQALAEPDVVRFASACAAVACTRSPSVREAPALGEITALMKSQAV